MVYRRRPSGEKIFEDRRSAGKELAEWVLNKGCRFDAVVGLTRGGVPVAYEVATAMGLPLDVVVVKKLRAPTNPELAIGAVSSGGGRVLREDIIHQLGVSPQYVFAETEARAAEAEADEKTYRGTNNPLVLKGFSVAIVDDGIATGSSIEAAVLSIRQKGSIRIIVATPVASKEACSDLLRVADVVFCMTTPRDFWAVGAFYRDFSQTPDEQVRKLLDANRSRRNPQAPPR